MLSSFFSNMRAANSNIMVSLILSISVLSSIILFCSGDPKIKRNFVVDFFKREKCIADLGCFSAAAPFFDFEERPLSLLPDDREVINTKFSLYTRQFPSSPMNFSNMDASLAYLSRSGFDPKLSTKFIVPGYISRTAPYWQMPLKDALLHSQPCNVFYVDWSGGDGPLYEQAVANTRVVGAEVALFIERLTEMTGLKAEDVHILGHSLGSHIAGYAGKRTKNLGRITGMDPAGPYFTDVDPIVRLDRNDAILVEAIHTNAAPSRFEGFGLTESIAHYDFYPNGGHIQPGCPDLSHAIWDFLKHPSLDPEGLQDLMCNHGRAIDLVISSLLQTNCKLLGCTAGHPAVCVPLALGEIQSTSHQRAPYGLDLFLSTTDTQPFCIQ